jgi:hypothetical protein
MAMDRPEDELPPFYIEAAQAVVDMPPMPTEEATGKAIEAVRRAILKAREDAFGEAAKIAEEYGGFVEDTGSPPSDFTNSGKNEAATDIASAIRQHSQKGEK